MDKKELQMKLTHTEFIKIGNGHAFITGVKDRCNHDMSGTCYQLGNGDVLYEKDYRCPTNEATFEYIQKIANDRNTYISGGSVCCSKCGRYITEGDLIRMDF